MKQIEITYTRKVTFSKVVKCSNKLADRLLKVEDGDLIQRNGSWGGGEDDEEKGEGIYRLSHVSTDNFTMIAEDLTDMHDAYDSLNEIEDIDIRVYKEKKKKKQPNS